MLPHPSAAGGQGVGNVLLVAAWDGLEGRAVGIPVAFGARLAGG